MNNNPLFFNFIKRTSKTIAIYYFTRCAKTMCSKIKLEYNRSHKLQLIKHNMTLDQLQ